MAFIHITHQLFGIAPKYRMVPFLRIICLIWENPSFYRWECLVFVAFVSMPISLWDVPQYTLIPAYIIYTIVKYLLIEIPSFYWRFIVLTLRNCHPLSNSKEKINTQKILQETYILSADQCLEDLSFRMSHLIK